MNMNENQGNNPVQIILEQLEGYTYRQALQILECVKFKLQDFARVERRTQKSRLESQPSSEDKT